jgi:hypothetical protein
MRKIKTKWKPQPRKKENRDFARIAFSVQKAPGAKQLMAQRHSRSSRGK